jgi:hypothetical protein
MSLWWNFLFMFIQGNLVTIIFQGSIQLIVSSFLNFDNKLNFFVCIVFLFAAIFYSFTFYPLIYSYSNKGPASLILTYSLYEMKSYIFEPLTFLLRNVMRTMIQSLFQYYQLQINALIISDIISIAIVIKFRN